MFGNRIERVGLRLFQKGSMALAKGLHTLRECKGQGTTEYAILVGVLVVIAIIAVVAFRGKLQELWDAISAGVNSL
jgi:Flp pilus assembly pilin Flp